MVSPNASMKSSRHTFNPVGRGPPRVDLPRVHISTSPRLNISLPPLLPLHVFRLFVSTCARTAYQDACMNVCAAHIHARTRHARHLLTGGQQQPAASSRRPACLPAWPPPPAPRTEASGRPQGTWCRHHTHDACHTHRTQATMPAAAPRASSHHHQGAAGPGSR